MILERRVLYGLINASPASASSFVIHCRTITCFYLSEDGDFHLSWPQYVIVVIHATISDARTLLYVCLFACFYLPLPSISRHTAFNLFLT